MSRYLSAFFVGVGIAVLSLAQSAHATPITIEIKASAAPNFFGSPSWGAYQTNALNSLENGLGSTGDPNTDPTGHSIISGTYTPGDVMVTSFNSWQGQYAPGTPFDNELGNRLHFGLHIYGDGVVQFKLSDLSFAIASSDGVLDFAGDFSGSAFNCTSRYGINWGGDRAKGGGDDTTICSGNTDLIDELVYVGVGNAYWPGGGPVPAGTEQSVINGVVSYINSVQPIIMGSYSIIGTDGTTYTNKETLTLAVPEPASILLLGAGLAGLGFARRRRRER